VSQPIPHSRAFELLPWLVNGSLDTEERDAVEQHVRSCLACHRELKEQQHLRAALRAQPAVHLSPQTNFEKLARSLDGPPAIGARPARRFEPFLRFAVAAAVAAIAVGAVLWLSPTRLDTRGDYQTLSRGAAAAPGQIDIVFGQSVTQAQMQSLLEEIGGKIEAGPSGVGRYRVRLEAPIASDARLDALLAKLNNDPRVRFAARALTEDAGP
jgi:putative zinc finger protein